MEHGRKVEHKKAVRSLSESPKLVAVVYRE